jgi:hypothetical protein
MQSQTARPLAPWRKKAPRRKLAAQGQSLKALGLVGCKPRCHLELDLPDMPALELLRDVRKHGINHRDAGRRVTQGLATDHDGTQGHGIGPV